MLDNWLRPVATSLLSDLDPLASCVGNHIQVYTSELPTLRRGSVALIGIHEEEANAVRRQLYPLSIPFRKLRIADLGNVRREEASFLAPVLQELLESRVLPILIGRDPHFIQAQFLAHLAVQSPVCLSVVDGRAGWAPRPHPSIPEDYLSAVVQHPAAELLHLSLLGVQSHFVPASLFQLLDDRLFDCMRLGQIRTDLTEAEPLLRDADSVGIHLGSLRQSDAPGVRHPAPGGLLLEEACQIARYAGMSDKLGSIGLYGFCREFDQRDQTAQALAQMIWYFLEGVFQRKNDFPASADGLTAYLVDIKPADLQVTFWKSNKSGRWWIQIGEEKRRRYKRHRLAPCSYKDYLSACNGEIPERLMRALKRL